MSVANPYVLVFLGAGGVGKTTLSVACALALARDGKRVALLSVDPAKRLQSALGAGVLGDELTKVDLPENFSGELFASQLNVEQLLSRWIRNEGMSREAERKLRNHVLFQTLVHRVATMGDSLAAARIAEIVEIMPQLDCVVVDTAPGMHAIDFIVKPQKLHDFLNGKVAEVLKHTAGTSAVSRMMRRSAGKLLDLMGGLGGLDFLQAFSELLLLSEELFSSIATRIDNALVLLRSASAKYILVATVRDDALAVARDLEIALSAHKLPPSLSVLNRAISSDLIFDEGFIKFLDKAKVSLGEERVFANYIRGWIENQRSSEQTLSQLSPELVEIPLAEVLHSGGSIRLQDLAALGEPLKVWMRKKYKR